MDIFADNDFIKRLETKRSGIFKLQLDARQLVILAFGTPTSNLPEYF